jgi:AraC family transcriptional regulator of adaptative response/methylated-DNA-[protein]-cysteine methyltransferase
MFRLCRTTISTIANGKIHRRDPNLKIAHPTLRLISNGAKTMNEQISSPVTQTLRFGFGRATVATILVAVSERGIAAILLGNDESRLRKLLDEAFPDALLVADQNGMQDTLDTVVAFVERPGSALELPLDLKGTLTQLAVWDALRSIPSGETVSYGQLAKTLPVPATAKEVGEACAANVIAVAIPCHRVLKADGSISGYRWGVARKAQLLAMERAARTS